MAASSWILNKQAANVETIVATWEKFSGGFF
jgi:hypothetical protein